MLAGWFLNEWGPLLLRFLLKGWRSIGTRSEVSPGFGSHVNLNAKSGCFHCWWLRLPMALRHGSPLFGCFVFRIQVKHFAPSTLSSLQVTAMAVLVPEPPAPSCFSASLPLPGLWGWWPGLVLCSCVTSAQTAVKTAVSLPLQRGCCAWCCPLLIPACWLGFPSWPQTCLPLTHLSGDLLAAPGCHPRLALLPLLGCTSTAHLPGCHLRTSNCEQGCQILQEGCECLTLLLYPPGG